MPTGYTSQIKHGIGFREFVLTCARGMGACIMQRDEPAGAPPRAPEASTYHAEKASEAEQELARLKAMKPDAIAEQAEAANVAARLRWEQRCRENDELRAKYRAMRDEVAAWEPPTPEHVGLKKFMLEQIDESESFDCHERIDPPRQLSAAEWHHEQLRSAVWSLDYHTSEQRSEDERTRSRKEWIEKLYASLPEEA